MNTFEPEWILRLIAAMLAGIAIGYERHVRAKDAGIKTHAVLATAAALLMIVSQHAFIDAPKVDASRVAAQVVSGVGFLGAGVIFVRNEMLKGLTTAAGIFATAAIGMTVGAGMYLLGAAATIIVVGIQIAFDHPAFTSNRIHINLLIRMDENGDTDTVIDCLHAHDWHNAALNISAGSDGYIITTSTYTSKKSNPYDLLRAINALPHIISAEFN
jgi:putative Mg2+ transporter-C (MgtC) family protein